MKTVCHDHVMNRPLSHPVNFLTHYSHIHWHISDLGTNTPIHDMWSDLVKTAAGCHNFVPPQQHLPSGSTSLASTKLTTQHAVELATLSPQYLIDKCHPTGRQQLWPSNVATCDIRRTCTSLGNRSFTIAGPSLWNNLPLLPSAWFWTDISPVLPVTENTFIWLRIVVPIDWFLDLVQFTHTCTTYLLTYLPSAWHKSLKNTTFEHMQLVTMNKLLKKWNQKAVKVTNHIM